MWKTWVWDGTVLKDEAGKAVELNQERPHGKGVLRYYQTSKARLVAFFTINPRRYVSSVKLERPGEYRFGDEYGHRKMSPEDEQDPVKRVFRELDIPCSDRHLQVIPECSPQGRDAILNEAKRNGCMALGLQGFLRINDRGQVEESWVFTGASPQELKAELLDALYGPDADEEFLEVLQAKDLFAAREWLAKKFGFQPHYYVGDSLDWQRLSCDDMTCYTMHFAGNYKQQLVITDNPVFVQLALRFGFAPFIPFMNERGQQFILALENQNEALAYATQYYDWAYVKGFPGFPLRVSPKEEPLEEKLFSSPGDPAFGGVASDIQALLHHKNLVEKLRDHPATLVQQAHDYNEKVLTRVQDHGKKLLMTVGSATFEHQRGEFDMIPLGGLEVTGLRSPKAPLLLTKDTEIVAQVMGEFVFDKASARMLVKKDAPGLLGALVWRDGRYNVITLGRKMDGSWVDHDPRATFEVFVGVRGYFRLVHSDERFVEQGHPFLLVSTPTA